MSALAPPDSTLSFLDGKPKLLFIDGHWIESSSEQFIESINPATGRVIGVLSEASEREIDLAVAAARRAFETWKTVRPNQRQLLILRLADLVEQHFDELSWLDSIDMGMPIARALSLRQRTLGRLRYYAGQSLTIQGETIQNSLADDIVTYTIKEPIGVVAAIIPWNGPLGAIAWKIGPVLATGCTVVLKPPAVASLTAIRLAELIAEAGIPPGVINVITGRGETVGARLVQHPGVDLVAFTGSLETGRSIIKASAGNVKRLSLELGGKSPNIVFADADLDAAAVGVAMGAFNNTGQVCNAGTRLFVEQGIYDSFVQSVADYAESLRVGSPADPSTQLGPIVSQQQLDRVMGYVARGLADGARVQCGGERLTDAGLRDGYYVRPTVFSDVSDEMQIARDEIFGPVLSALAFSDPDDLIRRANSSDFGLSGGVWTRDVGKAHRVAHAIRAGTMWVNCYQLSDPAVPHGGEKMSGYGRSGGTHHVDEYLTTKAIWIKT